MKNNKLLLKNKNTMANRTLIFIHNPTITQLENHNILSAFSDLENLQPFDVIELHIQNRVYECAVFYAFGLISEFYMPGILFNKLIREK